MSKEDIIKEVKQYFNFNENTKFLQYYFGITDDAERRLFTEHKVDRNNDCWIYCPANSKACAQEIEEYFLDLGMDGDTGGGNDDTTIVYCYKKNAHTNP